MRNEKLILRAMKYGISLGIALLCAVLFAACDHPVTAPLENGYGRISVSCTEAGARTLFPETKDFAYEYFFAKGTEAEKPIEPETDGSFILEIGDYTVRVEARLNNTLVAEGVSKPFTVGSGVNAPVEVELTPASDPAEKGTFSYIITYPKGAVADVTLLQWPGKNSVTLDSAAITTDENGKTAELPQQELDAGYYLLTVLISKDGKYAGTSEAVHISPSVPTVYRATFAEDELIELITVSIDNILGVTPPAVGEEPVTAITPTDQYTGTVEWSPNDAAFQAETEYTATITLTPETDYTLYGVAVNFFNVSSTKRIKQE